MIAEALDTLQALLIAGGIWLITGSIALLLVLTLAVLGLYGIARATWRALRGHNRPTWARSRAAARRYARRGPDYEEAA
ncbi:hypothetical protein GCM10022384_07630 [Streptomyces marokkonensis]|uniref:Uncharacterized protein n=1 Tax=Streptomyces marokkonensis TaxID=324855 RepID=A0ABP7P0E6_9ACTN